MTDAQYLAEYFNLKRKDAFVHDYHGILIRKWIAEEHTQSIEAILSFYCWYSSVPRIVSV